MRQQKLTNDQAHITKSKIDDEIEKLSAKPSARKMKTSEEVGKKILNILHLKLKYF